jgi:hypothetical protein
MGKDEVLGTSYWGLVTRDEGLIINYELSIINYQLLIVNDEWG